MSRLPLNPVASPVNTYAPAEVRATGDGGTELASLAAGLQQFAGGVDKLSQRLFQDHIEASREEARTLITKHSLQSMDDFKSAVERGEITDTNNPWQRIFVGQLVSQREVSNRAADLRAKYDAPDTVDSSGTPLKFSDNVRDVQKFFDSGFADIFEGRDAWQTEAMHKQLDQERNQFVQQHERERTHQRKIDTQASVTTTLSEMLNTYHSAPTDDSFSALQAFAEQATKTLPASSLRPMIAKAILDHARESMDPSSAKELLSKLSVGGELVGRGIDGGFWEALDRDIEDRQTAIDNRNYQTRKRQQDEAADEVFRGILAAKAMIPAGMPVDFTKLPVDLSQLDRQTITQLERFTQEINQDQANEALRQFVSGGDTSPKALATFSTRLLSTLGPSASHVIEMAKGWQNLNDTTTSGYAKEVTPETMTKFEAVVHDHDKPILERLDYVNRNAAQLVPALHKEYLNYLYTAAAPSQQAFHQASQQIVAEFADDIVSTFYTDPNAFTQTENGRSLNPLYHQKALDARNQLNSFYRKLWITNPELGGAELVKRVEAERDRVFQKFTGIRPEMVEERRNIMAATQAVESGRLNGNVVWKDGTLMLKAGGVEVAPTAPVRVFNNAAQMTNARSVADVADQLGLKSFSELETLLRSQARLFGPEALPVVETFLEAAKMQDEDALRLELQYFEGEQEVLRNQWLALQPPDPYNRNPANDDKARKLRQQMLDRSKRAKVMEDRLEVLVRQRREKEKRAAIEASFQPTVTEKPNANNP